MPGTITVRKAPKGPFITIQDLGRYGHQKSGIPVAGALDRFALETANWLVGNPPGAACLEVTLIGPEIVLDQDTVISITGADLSATLDGRPISLWTSHDVSAGSVLQFGKPVRGVRAYLAVAGGIDVSIVMGSRSTYLKGHIGGFQGRALQTGDILPIGEPAVTFAPRRLSKTPDYIASHGEETVVRVVLGPQEDHFTQAAIATFLSSTYRITPQSDRMGYRLEGPPLAHRGRAEIISDAIPEGAIQVPANGQPIILLADRQTTGGYPKIATVISADLPKLAQSAPGAIVRFVAVTVEEAQEIARNAARELAQVMLA
ncbi:urea carboxylase [Collibacillus ludicampi]|uniref:Urea carboxylase n=1 Tax=Collibacillus ludicampi TaxID=2771369 RepID=A0AAV4LCN3_9BACL|nr:biotin-dependent carboxyltransferase family protein [Collibacillus ludicampi]GIM45511.1 urea carboxylase [Collibacillus ludicampi]